MHRILSICIVATLAGGGLCACGGGSGGGNNPGGGVQPLVSDIGTTGVFAAWVDPIGGGYAYAPMGSYAGKKQTLRGTIDFLSGAELNQAAGVEIYKGSDGHIYALDLTSTSTPTAQQISTEYAATIDDTCTLSGTSVAGANYDYAGIDYVADLQAPMNSSYFYRLPGGDGVCNTADDVFHLVKTGMSATDAPIVATAMPVVGVHNAQGGIVGFVVKRGPSLVLVDSRFANPVVLGTFASNIGVAVALPTGTTQGYPTAQLFVIDGSIYYVDYVGLRVSTALYAIPNWLPTNAGALFAASPTTLYFAVNTAAAGATPASTSLYAMPADGSAAPSVVDTEPGRVATLVFPIQGSNLVYGVVIGGANPTYSVRVLPVGGGPITLAAGNGNSGTFIATATSVYYETWTGTTNTTTMIVTRSGTTAGIVQLDGTVVQAPLAGATFVNGGEQVPWPADTVTTATPYETVFEVQGLTTVTLTDASTGYTYIEDSVSGGTMFAIDAGTNQIGARIGTLPPSTATTLTGTFRGSNRTGFFEAAGPVSTENPTTRDLYLLDSQVTGSLTRVTGNL
jgi:hypothetical protein